MANNRLYLYDPETHEAFLLCKSSGEGWQVWARRELDDIAARLNAWLHVRDLEASWGNCGGRPTRLRLLTEGDLPPDVTRARGLDEGGSAFA